MTVVCTWYQEYLGHVVSLTNSLHYIRHVTLNRWVLLGTHIYCHNVMMKIALIVSYWLIETLESYFCWYTHTHVGTVCVCSTVKWVCVLQLRNMTSERQREKQAERERERTQQVDTTGNVESEQIALLIPSVCVCVCKRNFLRVDDRLFVSLIDWCCCCRWLLGNRTNGCQWERFSHNQHRDRQLVSLCLETTQTINYNFLLSLASRLYLIVCLCVYR